MVYRSLCYFTLPAVFTIPYPASPSVASVVCGRDGATRSGLLCAVSYMVERLKVEQDVDVFQSVKHTRINRSQLIPQYVSIVTDSLSNVLIEPSGIFLQHNLLYNVAAAELKCLARLVNTHCGCTTCDCHQVL